MPCIFEVIDLRRRFLVLITGSAVGNQPFVFDSAPQLRSEFPTEPVRLLERVRRHDVATNAVPFSSVVPTPPPPTQAEARLLRLVERIKAGDAQAFDELYKATRADVARTLVHLVGRRSDLEDLVQDTYLRLLKAIPSFRGESQFRTFLYRVCANVALMNLRWWRRRPEELTDEVPEQSSPANNPEQAAQATQAKRLVERALATLSAKKRIVFVYHELCGMGPEEIAEATGTEYNTVRSRLHSAREDFTQALRAIVAEEVSS